MLTSRLTLSVLTLAATFLAAACTPTPTSENEPATPAPVQSESAEVPTVAEPAIAPAATTEQTSDRRSGAFASAEHETLGRAELISENGQHKLVFDESFSTADGPDLVVVLHRSADPIAATTPPAYPLNEADYVVIAPLATTTGRQEYAIPAEIYLDDFQSVAVWCQQFNATFGAAPLQ